MRSKKSRKYFLLILTFCSLGVLMSGVNVAQVIFSYHRFSESALSDLGFMLVLTINTYVVTLIYVRSLYRRLDQAEKI